MDPSGYDGDNGEKEHPPSFLLTLSEIGNRSIATGEDEIKGLPSLHNENWSVQKPSGDTIEFRRRLLPHELRKIGVEGDLELVKRFTLHVKQDAPRKESWFNFLPASPKAKGALGYQLSMDIEIRNLGTNAETVGLQIDGPTGLTTEGWWYSRKIHNKKFSAAGARDLLWRVHGEDQALYTCNEIAKQFISDNEDKKAINPLNSSDPPDKRRLRMPAPTTCISPRCYCQPVPFQNQEETSIGIRRTLSM